MKQTFCLHSLTSARHWSLVLVGNSAATHCEYVVRHVGINSRQTELIHLKSSSPSSLIILYTWGHHIKGENERLRRETIAKRNEKRLLQADRAYSLCVAKGGHASKDHRVNNFAGSQKRQRETSLSCTLSFITDMRMMMMMMMKMNHFISHQSLLKEKGRQVRTQQMTKRSRWVEVQTSDDDDVTLLA